MKIIVTGAAGFIGSHLSERLVKLGHTVTGIDNFNDYYSPVLKQLNARQLEAAGVTMVRADLATDELEPLILDAAFVYHLAAQPGISAGTPFSHYERNNLVATYRLLEAVQSSASLEGFINIATSSIYGADATHPETFAPRPTSFYGVTKLAAEQLVMAYQRDKGLPACSLRLFSVYGPRERPEKLYPKLIHCILSDEPFPLHEGSLEHLRSYTYVDDIITGCIAALNNYDRCNGEILNIGTDTAMTTGEGIAIVEKLLGKQTTIDLKPERPGDQLKTHTNIDKARTLINYHPSITPEVGLEREVAWYREKVFGKINPYS